MWIDAFRSVQVPLLLLTNVFAWYFSNGMNGISMQKFSKELRADATPLTIGSNLEVIGAITAMQLLAGAFLGKLTLIILQVLTGTTDESKATGGLQWTPTAIFLSALHGVGSLATNFGFAYGSASLVQILKLVEPFETLFFTKILIPTEGKQFTYPVIISMSMVTLGAISLVQQQGTSPHPYAVFFAIVSGLSLSTRNVLQRKLHLRSPTEKNVPKSMAPPVKNEKSAIKKLQDSLVQFTRLSVQSGIVIGAWVLLRVLMNRFITEDTQLPIFPPVLLVWHPLYNLFSMVTLGFCSALTHSLLNAGKRVVAILMAIIWFHEPLKTQTLAALVVIGVGGGWYSYAVKAAAVSIQKQPVREIAAIEAGHSN